MTLAEARRRDARDRTATIDAAAPHARRRHRRARDRGQPHRRAAQRRRDLPGDARGDRRRRAHDRLPDVRLLGGRDRHASSPIVSPSAPGPASACGCCSTPRARARSTARSIALLERRRRHVRWFRPLRRFRLGEVNHRTHRKVMIVDEAVGFTGGVGIADEWRGDARERARVARHALPDPGPRRRRAARRVPRQLGRDRSGAVRRRRRSLPRAAASRGRRSCSACAARPRRAGATSPRCSARCCKLAEQRVRITTAYFVPDDELIERLCDAAERGVDGRDPAARAPRRQAVRAGRGRGDLRASCSTRGVRIWNFQPSMLHAKIMTVDGVIANVGSANLNARSTQLDEEINVVVLDEDLVAHARRPVRRGPRAQRRDRARPLARAVAHAAAGRAAGRGRFVACSSRDRSRRGASPPHGQDRATKRHASRAAHRRSRRSDDASRGRRDRSRRASRPRPASTNDEDRGPAVRRAPHHDDRNRERDRRGRRVAGRKARGRRRRVQARHVGPRPGDDERHREEHRELERRAPGRASRPPATAAGRPAPTMITAAMPMAGTVFTNQVANAGDAVPGVRAVAGEPAVHRLVPAPDRAVERVRQREADPQHHAHEHGVADAHTEPQIDSAISACPSANRGDPVRSDVPHVP